MLGLLGIGLGLVLGVAMRISAMSATLLLALMWAAEWPLARFTEAGKATSSTNPLIDSHIIYAGVVIVLALTLASGTWGWATPGPGCPSSRATAGWSEVRARRESVGSRSPAPRREHSNTNDPA